MENELFEKRKKMSLISQRNRTRIEHMKKIHECKSESELNSLCYEIVKNAKIRTKKLMYHYKPITFYQHELLAMHVLARNGLRRDETVKN